MGKKGSRSLDSIAWEWTEKLDNVITEENIKSSYKLLLPKCTNCRKNCSNNPRCFHGLGEAAWVKSSSATENEEFIQKVKQELNAERRSANELVGLRNLGATCYVNTYLQLWFHNLDFRRAIYALADHSATKDDCLPQTICGQLQLMFGLLQNSLSKSVDPTSFINCLGLPTDLQQDAQEFSKLFMCLLETTPGLSQVIQQQFSGKYAYVTRCLRCQTVVETAARFYELDLNIQGHKDLKSSILEYLKEEHLENDNQYFCNNCQLKQDAIRQIVLKELPPCLSIQLLRFVYDRASQRKHKINTNLSFPETLDFSSYVSLSEKANSTNLEYRLSAVLLHRGLSASSGHFVAHILDSSTNSWFQFNDEVVAKMKKGKKLHLDSSVSEDDVWSEINEAPAPKKLKTAKGRYSSKDVYMLVYTRKSENDVEVPQLPKQVAHCVEQENAKFEADLAKNLLKAEEEHKAKVVVEAKMEKLIKILNSDTSTTYKWVPVALLRNYFHSGKLQTYEFPLRSKFLCDHGNLSLTAVNSLKYVPKQAIDMIYADSNEMFCFDFNLCQACVYSRCSWLQGKRKLAHDAMTVSKVLHAFESSKANESENCFYVGRLSFRKWKFLATQDLNKKYQPKVTSLTEINEEFATESYDADEFRFNSDLLCSHKNLMIDLSTAVVVPQKIWDTLLKYFPNCPSFKVENCSQCLACYKDEKEKEAAKQLSKTRANKQKDSLYELYMNKNRPIYPSIRDHTVAGKNATERYYIVSCDFVGRWKDYIRNPNKYEPVDCVDNQVFLCEHKKLLYDLPSQLSISLDVKCDSDPKCVLLWNNEWDFIKKNFTIDFSICVEKRVIFPCSVVLEKMAVPAVVGLPDSSAAAKTETGDSGTVVPSVLIKSNLNNNFVDAASDAKVTVDVTISPALCCECIKGLAIEEQKKLQFYDDADIYVVKSTKTVIEMVEAVSRAEFSHSTNVRNIRSRRCARGEKRISNISSNFTLKQLKLKIMTLFSVPPFDQNLWLNGKFLSDDSATLGSLDIIPECTLTLVEDLPNPDDVPFICETSKSAEPEVGFLGTSLIGHS